MNMIACFFGLSVFLLKSHWKQDFDCLHLAYCYAIWWILTGLMKIKVNCLIYCLVLLERVGNFDLFCWYYSLWMICLNKMQKISWIELFMFALGEIIRIWFCFDFRKWFIFELLLMSSFPEIRKKQWKIVTAHGLIGLLLLLKKNQNFEIIRTDFSHDLVQTLRLAKWNDCLVMRFNSALIGGLYTEDRLQKYIFNIFYLLEFCVFFIPRIKKKSTILIGYHLSFLGD